MVNVLQKQNIFSLLKIIDQRKFGKMNFRSKVKIAFKLTKLQQ